MSEVAGAAARLSRLALLLMFAALLSLAACSDEQQASAPAAEDVATDGDAQAMADAEPAHEQISWDLSDIYASTEAWEEARLALLGRIPELEAYQGRLGDGPDVLLEAMRLQSEVTQEAYKVIVYASMMSDEDQRVGEHQEMRQLGQEMGSRLTQATSWATPEILELGAERVMEYIASDPEGFDQFRFTLQNVLRNAPHTLSSEGERIMALAALPTNQALQTYSLLVNSDIEWPTITLSDGTEAYLNPTGYSFHRRAQNRADREAVFATFWGKWTEFQATAGQILNSHIQGQVFTARARHFDSSLQMNLDEDNLPTEVYDTLIEQANAALPLLHRYLGLRARILGVEDLGYHDIYPTAVEIDRTFTIEDSRDLLIEAVQPLGEDYVERLSIATAQDWQHVYPQAGKRGGAYMNGGAYGIHPYVLLNHTDDYDSFGTYGHEWGHALHTMYSQESQAFNNAFYSTFIAETAAIVNQILSEEHLIANAETDEERLFYIDRVLEQYRGTLFRQTMFAEFEQAAYNEVEEGRPLTGQRLTDIYLELVRRYHGHDDGVMNIADEIGMEWAYIPHFYRNHYVFQYSTSQVISDYFAGRIMAGDQEAVDQLLQVLRAGGSDFPYNIVLNAGLDMASADAYQPALARLERMLDEYEELLDRLGY
jgi:oligoendopeptidase F